MRTFLLKAKHFFKRNIYPITVSLCTALVIGIVGLSDYSSIKKNNTSVQTGTQSSQSTGENVSETIESKPTVSDDVLIFDLPFENASVSKEYAETKLLYDSTTKLWCTHQALDFDAQDGMIAKAVYDGKITKIESSMMNGTVVYLKVSDTLTVCYKGLGSDVSVKEGDEVKKGQNIGKITGMLAEKADGVHLHLELLKQDKLVDPTEYFSFNK
jgi:stage II sporulation protein Q